MKKFLVFFFLSFPLTASYSQDLLLEWNEFYHLTWSDFHGRPAATSMGDAATAVLIRAKPYYEGNILKYNVAAFFNRSKSWMRDTSSTLLAHEQLHFHIAELYARKIRRAIDDLARSGEKDIAVYNTAIKELLAESNGVDRLYDTETLHGALAKKQSAWRDRISRELKELEKWRKKKQVIGHRRLKRKPSIYARGNR